MFAVANEPRSGGPNTSIFGALINWTQWRTSLTGKTNIDWNAYSKNGCKWRLQINKSKVDGNSSAAITYRRGTQASCRPEGRQFRKTFFSETVVRADMNGTSQERGEPTNKINEQQHLHGMSRPRTRD